MSYVGRCYLLDHGFEHLSVRLVIDSRRDATQDFTRSSDLFRVDEKREVLVVQQDLYADGTDEVAERWVASEVIEHWDELAASQKNVRRLW